MSSNGRFTRGVGRLFGPGDDSGLPLDKVVFGVAAVLSVAFVLAGRDLAG
jgi:hypothetical protein